MTLLLIAGEAGAAAWRIGLAALSHDGERAIVVYDYEWVEVELATGATELLTPPPTCSWTSAAYAPEGRDFALTAHCVADLACHTVRAGVWLRDARWGLVNVARVFGRRWNDAVWRRGAHGDEVLVRETAISRPLALGLGDLGASEDCAQGDGRFAMITVPDGRVAGFDVAPRGWAVAAPLAAARGGLVALMRATARSNGGTSAEEEIAALCADPPPKAEDARVAVCGEAGLKMHFEWRDGDWLLLDDGAPGRGRLIVSADMAVSARERCETSLVNGRLKPACVIAVEDGPEIKAPGGLFGDLRFSGDGRFLASLVAGRGFRIRRFDVYDLETGEARDLSALLDIGPPWDASR